jgi:hypothetical protein
VERSITQRGGGDGAPDLKAHSSIGLSSAVRARSAVLSFGSGLRRDDTRGLLGLRDRPRTFRSSCALPASSSASGVITEAEFNAKKPELLGRT